VGVDGQVYRLSEGRLLRLPEGKYTPIEKGYAVLAEEEREERERKGESKEAFLREMRSAKISEKKRRNTASFSDFETRPDARQRLPV